MIYIEAFRMVQERLGLSTAHAIMFLRAHGIKDGRDVDEGVVDTILNQYDNGVSHNEELPK